MSLRNNDVDSNGGGEVLPTYEETVAPPPSDICIIEGMSHSELGSHEDDLDGLPSYMLATTSGANIAVLKSDESDASEDMDVDLAVPTTAEEPPSNVVVIHDDVDEMDNDDDDSTPLLTWL